MRVYLPLGLLALTSLVGLATACSDEGDDSSSSSTPREPNTDGPISFEDYLVVAGRLRCKQAHKCCSTDVIEGQPFLGSSEQECITLNDGLARSTITNWLRDAVAEGRMAYDAQAMKDCYDKLSAIDCGVTDQDWTCVDRVLTGMVPIGGECKEDTSECADGRCDLDTHLCAPWFELGETCDLNAHCTSGYCNHGNQMCQERVADGETCFFDADCVSRKCDTDARICVAAEHDNGCPADGRVLDVGTPSGP